MTKDIAVRVSNIGKCYQVYAHPRDRLLQMFFRGRRKLFREFWALKDVAFQVSRGETVGIVGRNGAGKSTLLQIIAGTLTPTCGSVEVTGRVGALLELGTGFNPEFSGRENVYLTGAVLGLDRREVDGLMDVIREFASIGEFFDQPVKTYSSGMVVRLGFAIQAQTSPDVLIVDEALAVGDAKFQARCFEHLRRLQERGTSILFVSHSTEQIVSHCDRALLIDEGRIVIDASPREVVNRYLEILFGRELVVPSTKQVVLPGLVAPSKFRHLSFADGFASRYGYNPHEFRWGDRAASIQDFELLCGDGNATQVAQGEQLRVGYTVLFHSAIERPIYGFAIKTKEGITIYNTNSEWRQTGTRSTVTAGATVVVRVDMKCRLAPGDYFISVGVASRTEVQEVVPHDRRYDSIHLHVIPSGKNKFDGLVDLDAELALSVVNAASMNLEHYTESQRVQ